MLSLEGLDLSAAGSRPVASVMTIVTWWLSKSLSIPGGGKLHYCSAASYQVALRSSGAARQGVLGGVFIQRLKVLVACEVTYLQQSIFPPAECFFLEASELDEVRGAFLFGPEFFICLREHTRTVCCFV